MYPTQEQKEKQPECNAQHSAILCIKKKEQTNSFTGEISRQKTGRLLFQPEHGRLRKGKRLPSRCRSNDGTREAENKPFPVALPAHKWQLPHAASAQLRLADTEARSSEARRLADGTGGRRDGA